MITTKRDIEHHSVPQAMATMRTFMTIIDVIQFLNNNPSLTTLYVYVHGVGDTIPSDRSEHLHLVELLIRSATPELVGPLLRALRLPALRTLEICFQGNWPIDEIRSLASPSQALLQSMKMYGNTAIQPEELFVLANALPFLQELWAFAGAQDLVNRDVRHLMMIREMANN